MTRVGGPASASGTRASRRPRPAPPGEAGRYTRAVEAVPSGSRVPGDRLGLGAVHQPVLVGADQGVAHRAVPAVQGEDHAALVAVLLLPPPDVRDRLVRVLVAQVV